MPLDVYYLVQDHAPSTDVFSTKRHIYVDSATDPAYLTWVGLGNTAIGGLTEPAMLYAIRSRSPYAREIRAFTEAPVTLVNLIPGASFSSITLKVGDVIGLAGQVDLTENGLWEIQFSGAPLRALDYIGSFYDLYPASSQFKVTEGSYSGSIVNLNTTGASFNIPGLLGDIEIDGFETLANQDVSQLAVVGGTISGTDVLTAGGRIYDQSLSRGTATQVYHGGTSPAYTSVTVADLGSNADTDGTLAANSDTKVATQKATKTYVDARTVSSSTDNAAARFDGTSGDLQNSAFIIDDSGHVSSFGGNIKFPGTQVSSADANTLDDYEEGTFTPTFSGSTTPGSHTYTIQVGNYTKVGNIVFVGINVEISAKDGAAAGNIRVAGLPFIGKNVSNLLQALAVGAYGFWDLNTGLGMSQITTSVTNNTTVAALIQAGDNASRLTMTVADMGATATLRLGGPYLTD